MTIALVILAILALFLGYVATRPGDFALERTRVIKATPDAIFPHLGDFRAWEAWSPWVEMDPTAKMTYSDSVGKGSSYSWDGKKTGSGSATMLESRPGQGVDVQLNFEKPMKAVNMAKFNLSPEGDATRVTWRMTGNNGFMGKLFSMFMNVDKMVGGQFDRGLEKLAALCEPATKPAA